MPLLRLGVKHCLHFAGSGSHPHLRIHARTRAPMRTRSSEEAEMSIETGVGALTALLLTVYLFYALLKPEHF